MRFKFILSCFFAALIFFTVVESPHADSYQWTDRDGSVHFTDDISKVPAKFRPKASVDVNEDVEQYQDGGYSGVRVTGATILDYGIFSAGAAGEYGGKTISGAVTIATDPHLVERTGIVKAKIGTTFGIAYQVMGTPSDGKADLTIKVISPLLRDPKTGESSAEQSWLTPKTMYKKSHDFYRFDEPWELVPGTWIMQVIYRGKVLASQSFVIQ